MNAVEYYNQQKEKFISEKISEGLNLAKTWEETPVMTKISMLQAFEKQLPFMSGFVHAYKHEKLFGDAPFSGIMDVYISMMLWNDHDASNPMFEFKRGFAFMFFLKDMISKKELTDISYVYRDMVKYYSELKP